MAPLGLNGRGERGVKSQKSFLRDSCLEKEGRMTFPIPRWTLPLVTFVMLCTCCFGSFCGVDTMPKYRPVFAKQNLGGGGDTYHGVKFRSNAHVRTACTYAPIRIALDWTTFDADVTDSAKRSYFKNTLMPRALAWFTSALQVCPISGNPYYADKVIFLMLFISYFFWKKSSALGLGPVESMLENVQGRQLCLTRLFFWRLFGPFLEKYIRKINVASFILH